MSMDCNKDDAIKAKEIAERKFNAKDISGAKKFALKAHALYPGLEGISQMLATLDVYVSAENRIYGESDWYGILGLTPQADDDTIRKQYRKLALMLHPDKNKSLGAEGAFKCISEAWSLLSDKNKRAAYDAKRNAKVFPPKPKPPSDSSTVPPSSNGFYNFAKTSNSTAKVNKNASRANVSSASGSTNKPHRKNTFWTVCHRCKMQYEYLRTYLNHNLLCPNCHKPFFAIETPPPVANGPRSSKPWSSATQYSHQDSRNKSSPNVGHNTTNVQWTPFSGAAGASSVAQAANVVRQTYEKVKRVREEAQAARKREKAAKRKSYASDNMAGSYFEKKRVTEDLDIKGNQMGLGATGFGMARNGNFDSVQVSRASRFNSNRELTQLELRNILMFKAQKEISQKLSEWNSASMENNATRQKVIEKAQSKDNTVNVEINSEKHESESSRTFNTGNGNESSPNTTVSAVGEEMLNILSIPVPDPDFYDFDKDRTERAFEENQVWAVYDNDDGMPRYYAMIHSVISWDPFKVRIIWLTSKTDSELGTPHSGSGFSKTCGEFRQGRHETYDSLNCFSHKVRWTTGARGVIRIFPRKGDVWALYRNWSPNWDEITSNEDRCKYEMVEVLEDYDGLLGAVVIPLVKVAGFKAVFHQHLDPKQARRIRKEELFQFSYQVPSHLISGQEAPNAPKGCRELDPAALPPEFLQVIADVKEEDSAKIQIFQ